MRRRSWQTKYMVMADAAREFRARTGRITTSLDPPDWRLRREQPLGGGCRPWCLHLCLHLCLDLCFDLRLHAGEFPHPPRDDEEVDA
eukprot:9127708-Alexandrium_andersonii.AAC.1